MQGPRKTPIDLKVLRMGAKAAQKLLAKKTPTPGPLAEAPDWLSAEQKADWAYAIENAPREVLRRIDKAVLTAFIIAQDTHQRATVAMMKMELLVESPKQQQNPYLPIINRQAVLMIRAANELGFTPCARARIDCAATAPAAAGDWEDIA